MPDHDIKLDDIEEPFNIFPHNDISSLSTSVYKNHIRELSEVRIYFNKNLIFGSYEEKKVLNLLKLEKK